MNPVRDVDESIYSGIDPGLFQNYTQILVVQDQNKPSPVSVHLSHCGI